MGPVTYCCITCEFDKARANNAPGRRNLRPMIPPAAVTRDTAAGATTSSVGGETPSELATPVGLGGQGPALDTYPGSRGRVSGLPGHICHVAARAVAAMEAPTVGVVS